MPKNTNIKICKTTILSAALHGRETTSDRLRMFENRVLRRMAGSKRESEKTGGLEKTAL
jgi:hypothetical protein